MTKSLFSSQRSSVLGLTAAICAAVLALTGCPTTYPTCSSDEACKDHGQVCVNGQCQECGSDANCKQGFVCQAAKCVPKPECSADADCPNGGICNDGKCGVPECKADDDCKEGKCQAGRCKATACTTKSDCKSGEDCQGGFCHPAVSSNESCDFGPIRFGFNEAGLSSDARSQLAKDADCIKKEKGKVTLEGHADDRGTEEYNLQLSNRRAASVRKYLTDLGVKAKQLDSVGYGASRPAVEGANEEAWAANRRVEFNRSGK
jgi:peptidoglycan-associated lipoprotein